MMKTLRAAGALALAMCVAAPAFAQGFPNKPVTMVVPYAPGGGTDAIARRLAQALSTQWGQTVVVENVAGADGVIGTQRVLRAPADGYTLMMQISGMLLWKFTMPSAKVDVLGDLRMVSKIQHSPMVLAVSSKFPGNTMKEFVSWCQTAQPPCSWGSSTEFSRLAGNTLMYEMGIRNAVNVPYKGVAPANNDLLGGHVTMTLGSVSSSLPQMRSGQLKYLAIGSKERFPAVPHVPTMMESGYKVEADSWFGIMVAKDTPQPVFDTIVASIQKASKDPGLLAAIEAAGGAPIFGTPQQFEREVREEMADLEKAAARFAPPKQ